MSLEDVKNSAQEVLGVGINKRRVTPISGPSLTRHIAVWLPTGQSDDNSYDRAIRFDNLITTVCSALRGCTTTRQAFDSNSWSDHDDAVTLFQGTLFLDTGEYQASFDSNQLHRSVKIFCKYEHVPLSVVFDMHEEMSTITLILDCSDRLPAEAEVTRFVQRLRAIFKVIDKRPNWTVADITDASGMLFIEVWKELDIILGLDALCPALGRTLLDARGVVLSADRAGESADQVVLSPPFSHLKTAEHTAPARIANDGQAITSARISTILPLLTCRMPSTVEYTLSQLMGKRALYATSLESGPDAARASQPSTVSYLLLADAHNSWQLGRLVYRIHRAGGSRVAATKHFDILRGRAQRLRTVERLLEDSLSKSSLANTTKSKIDLEEARDAAIESYEKIETLLDTLLDYGQHEALSYRVDRSRYYVRQFKRATDAMRIERVEGFQPYDEYVDQRQGSAFALIDLLGRRYERIQSDRSLLLRRIQVFNAQINETEISVAQWTADAALFVVLGPYYAAHVAIEMLHPWIGGEHGNGARLIWASFLVAGMLALYLRQLSRKNDKQRDKRPFPKLRSWRPNRKQFIALVLALLAIGGFYALERTFPERHLSAEGQTGLISQPVK